MIKFNRKYYSGLHFHKSIRADQIEKFEEILNDESCDIFNRIKVIRQIGSESLYATIWEIDFYLSDKKSEIEPEKIKLAIKVQKNVEKTLSEIDINNFLQETESEHFLRFYGNVYCENINLVNDSSFSGYFMFMDLAIGDLAQYISGANVSQSELEKFVSEIYEAIYHLGIHQIYHGDLHLKNAFIVKDVNIKGEGNLRAVIGDFGESEATDSITAHTSDIVKFSSSLAVFLKGKRKYPSLERKLLEVVKVINRMTPAMEDRFNPETDNFEPIVRKTVDVAKKIITS
jgi:hypothetical protein